MTLFTGTVLPQNLPALRVGSIQNYPYEEKEGQLAVKVGYPDHATAQAAVAASGARGDLEHVDVDVDLVDDVDPAELKASEDLAVSVLQLDLRGVSPHAQFKAPHVRVELRGKPQVDLFDLIPAVAEALRPWRFDEPPTGVFDGAVCLVGWLDDPETRREVAEIEARLGIQVAFYPLDSGIEPYFVE